jgi:hypothetical protein
MAKLMRTDGLLLAYEVMAGNTADPTAFQAMIAALRARFRIRRVIVVADRGRLSRDTVARLEHEATAPFDFILGCRMRQQTEVVETVLARAGRYHAVAENLEVKAVTVGGRRYVICRNPGEAKKDAAARAAILAQLETALQRGPKAVIGNTGFRRFLRIARGAVSIDPAAVARDERLDGKFVLRTNTALPRPRRTRHGRRQPDAPGGSTADFHAARVGKRAHGELFTTNRSVNFCP